MRIAGITLADNKRLEIALTGIYGVGLARAREILTKAGVPADKKPTAVSTEEAGRIKTALEVYKVEGALRREIGANIKRLVEAQTYRGSRHQRQLPSRGQRTKTNSRTRRGNVRRTMGSGRKKLEKK